MASLVQLRSDLRTGNRSTFCSLTGLVFRNMVIPSLTFSIFSSPHFFSLSWLTIRMTPLFISLCVYRYISLGNENCSLCLSFLSRWFIAQISATTYSSNSLYKCNFRYFLCTFHLYLNLACCLRLSTCG